LGNTSERGGFSLCSQVDHLFCNFEVLSDLKPGDKVLIVVDIQKKMLERSNDGDIRKDSDATTAPTSINVNRTGRYVRVQLAGTGSLALGEVQVWNQARSLSGWSRINLARPA
jgi:hypothetical protein